MVDIAKTTMNKIGEKITAISGGISGIFEQYLLNTMVALYTYVLDPTDITDNGKIIKYVLYLCCFLVLISIFTISIPYYTYKKETSGKNVSLTGKYEDYLDTYITSLIWVGVFLLILVLSSFIRVSGYVSSESINEILIRLIGISGLGLTGASIVSIFQALPFINIKRSMII
jgi:hypothetical protein